MAQKARRSPKFVQGDAYSVGPFEIASITADTSGVGLKFWRARRKCKVVRVDYHSVAGLATDGSNYFAISVRNGSTVVAGPRSTIATSISADTFTEIPVSATLADTILAAGDVLSFFADETGTATLPAGRVVVFVQDL